MRHGPTGTITPTSQSPQIGASLRTSLDLKVKNNLAGLNPLKSGQAFGQDRVRFLLGVSKVSIPSNRGKPSDPLGRCRCRSLIVSIPSNRGKPSDGAKNEKMGSLFLSLNPLKSGQAFGLKRERRIYESGTESQSPQIGASLRTNPRPPLPHA